MPLKKKKPSRFDDEQYLNDRQEPLETISEMSPVQVELTHKIAKNMTIQRISLRKIAARLRIAKRRKNARAQSTAPSSQKIQ